MGEAPLPDPEGGPRPRLPDSRGPGGPASRILGGPLGGLWEARWEVLGRAPGRGLGRPWEVPGRRRPGIWEQDLASE